MINMALVPISEMRQHDHPEANRIAREAIERASTFSMAVEIGDMDAGDKALGTLLYDSYYIGGYLEVHADDDGTGVVEKWDDITGSGYQTSVSAGVVIDGGVDMRGALATLGTADSLCSADDKIVFKSGVFDGTVAGQVTLFFKTVDDLGEDA